MHGRQHIGTLVSVLAFKRRFSTLVSALQCLQQYGAAVGVVPTDLEVFDADGVSPLAGCTDQLFPDSDAGQAALLLAQLGARIESPAGNARGFEGRTNSEYLIQQLLSALQLYQDRLDAVEAVAAAPAAPVAALPASSQYTPLTPAQLKRSIDALWAIVQHCCKARSDWNTKVDPGARLPLSHFAFCRAEVLEGEQREIAAQCFGSLLRASASLDLLSAEQQRDIRAVEFLRAQLPDAAAHRASVQGESSCRHCCLRHFSTPGTRAGC